MAYTDLRASRWSELGFTVAFSVANIARVMNRRYEGIRVQGPMSTVRIAKFNPGDLTVRTWGAETSDTEYGDNLTVAIDQDKSVSYEMPDLDPEQIPVDIAANVVEGMSMKLGRTMDQHVITTISGSNAGPTAISGSEQLVNARTLLVNNGYTDDDLWFFATPVQYANLLKDEDFQRAATANRGDHVESGNIQRAFGINVVEQSVDTVGGVIFNARAVGFIAQRAVEFKAADIFGGTAKFGTRIGAKALYKAFVLDSNGCLLITN